MFKTPTTVTALLVAGMALALAITLAACSQGGTFRSTSQGGTGGSTTISQGGTGGSAPICAVYPSCNPGDQQVTSGPELDYSQDCPPERECYSLSIPCGSTLCVLAAGLHCNDLLLCNPGDTPNTWAACVKYPSYCYTNQLCTQSISCESSASPYGGICSGIGSDAGISETGDASADGNDAGRKPCCGDGIVDNEYGEQCDMGKLNGLCLDQSLAPLASGENLGDAGCPLGPWGILADTPMCICPENSSVLCTTTCLIPPVGIPN